MVRERKKKGFSSPTRRIYVTCYFRIQTINFQTAPTPTHHSANAPLTFLSVTRLRTIIHRDTFSISRRRKKKGREILECRNSREIIGSVLNSNSVTYRAYPIFAFLGVQWRDIKSETKVTMEIFSFKNWIIRRRWTNLGEPWPDEWMGDLPFLKNFRGNFGGCVGGSKNSEQQPTRWCESDFKITRLSTSVGETKQPWCISNATRNKLN